MCIYMKHAWSSCQLGGGGYTFRQGAFLTKMSPILGLESLQEKKAHRKHESSSKAVVLNLKNAIKTTTCKDGRMKKY